jgi:dipeptidase
MLHRGAWERGISIHRTIFSFVAQVRPTMPSELAGLVWFGEDAPHATCFTPLYLSQESYAQGFTHGTMAAYDEDSAWWAAQVSAACSAAAAAARGPCTCPGAAAAAPPLPLLLLPA